MSEEESFNESFSPTEHQNEYSNLLSRKHSHTFLDTPIGSFRGVNSLHNFASSFTRAQSFAASKLDNEIHKKRSFFESPNNDDDVEDEIFDPELMMPSSRGERLSTVIHDASNRNRYFANSEASYNNDVFYQDDIIGIMNNRSRQNSQYENNRSGIPITKKINPSPSISSFRTSISLATTASHFNLKKIEDKDGNVITVLEGQSTAPQTIFNSINIMIGVGLLALPVGLLKAGWLLGLPLLIGCGLTSFWTATLISRIMDTDKTLMTYADLGYAAYGSIAKLIISLIFTVDLLGAGVSLIILFSDSLFALLASENSPSYLTGTNLKILSFFVLTPFTFLPLPILSIFSLFGIMSTISIIILVLICGFLKSSSPGSLLQVMPTNLYPNSILDLLKGLSIIAAPFGGHAIYPNLKMDMRHPHKFTRTLIPTYFITLLADCSMAIIGFFMFGHLCSNEVTNTLLTTAGYPSWCYPLISMLICVVPLAKTPLNAKPIISSLDSLFGVDKEVSTPGKITKFFNRVAVNALFVLLAILFPEFEKIIGILGASICFLICVILPCSFYIKICSTQIKSFERFKVLSIIYIAIFLSIASTWATLS